ncbi:MULTISPECIES: biotin--[acetyl-CoA-carboxylase] ligase [Ramlibacter]|uniref:Biotin--[acetyl-CoA-carboxylase] ligase n=1 Tax=Ramlibacter pinisoli TaxID=2682844 RepID=A0A6N8J0R9_9BURK|nr:MULTISPECIES: biotin--[acetyl-CoA-carboxylase] ligase [Ramlibacter]MBA2962891.1 biotin--[acetyl-CoA-carboxylase] ligase [Ramlibacter sp. CGMCC 1.13660]MVQ32834.1 biotin--[acetyl-CoA-carboxylase] ligase [Ramlibacter pinisoli]
MRWPSEAVWEQVVAQLPGFTVEVLPEIDSSNSELMRRARAGQLDPVLLVAERQSAGRGRLGRAWQARPGDSLTFSFGRLLAPQDWSGLSLAVGVALAGALHPDLRLKWPNDLWLGERKLAGILVETAAAPAPTPAPAQGRYAVVGVGINLAVPAADGLSTAPAGLRELLPGIEAGDALLRVAGALASALAAFEAGGFAPFQARFQALDLLAGRPLQLSDGTSGSGAGVRGDGALLVQTAGGTVAVTSAEVSVRPA